MVAGHGQRGTSSRQRKGHFPLHCRRRGETQALANIVDRGIWVFRKNLNLTEAARTGESAGKAWNQPSRSLRTGGYPGCVKQVPAVVNVLPILLAGFACPPTLVAVSGLQEIDRLVTDAIHQSVFLCYTARPAPGKHILERFGFAGAFEGVSHDCLNQIEDPKRNGTLVLHPEPDVFIGTPAGKLRLV
jgi:hypothetical protein